jgi:hypothetical protein
MPQCRIALRHVLYRRHPGKHHGRYFLSTHDITVNNEANSLLKKPPRRPQASGGDCAGANEPISPFIEEVTSQTDKISAIGAIMIRMRIT